MAKLHFMDFNQSSQNKNGAQIWTPFSIILQSDYSTGMTQLSAAIRW